MRYILFSVCCFLGIGCGNEDTLSIEKTEIPTSEQTNTPPVVESVEFGRLSLQPDCAQKIQQFRLCTTSYESYRIACETNLELLWRLLLGLHT